MKYYLEEIADIVRGVTFSKSEGSSIPSDDKLPVIRAGSVQDSLLLERDQIWVTKEKIRDEQKIRKDDIIMCMSSGSSDLVGKCAKSEQDFNGSFGAFCAGIRPNIEKVSPSYLYHFLNSPVFKNWATNASGANIKNIRASELAKFEIDLPPLEEQKRIAAILDKADAIRRKRQQAIQLADDFLRSVFLDMFGDPVTNPKGWPTATLDSICVRKGEYGSNQPATNFEEGDYRYIRITDIQDDGSLKEERVSLENQETEALKYTLAHGDLLFARSGATVGKTYLYDEKEGPCIFAGYLIRFKVIPEKAHPEFIKAVCNTQAYWNWVKSCQNVVAQPNINAKQYGQEFTFILPPLELQQKFIELTNKVKTQIAKNKKLNSSNLFDSLSQKAFRGEL